jgi:kynurenine formamidase
MLIYSCFERAGPLCAVLLTLCGLVAKLLALRPRRHHSNLQAVGMDIPSAASPVSASNAEGLEFHRVVLRTGAAPELPTILLIEDMRLEHLAGSPHIVWALPLLLEGADAAPITVLAEVEKLRNG